MHFAMRLHANMDMVLYAPGWVCGITFEEVSSASRDTHLYKHPFSIPNIAILFQYNSLQKAMHYKTKFICNTISRPFPCLTFSEKPKANSVLSI